MTFEQNYLDILEYLPHIGASRDDRTGVGTSATFGTELTHNWCDGFPVITHRTLNPKSAMAEMVCFIRGFTNISEFEARGCKWWRANLEDYNTRKNTPWNLDLGPIYGSKWRNFHGFDQLAWLLDEAKSNPHSRRLLVSAWDPSDQSNAVLPPCHYSWQIFIEGNMLDLKFNMRSVDWVLGCPADFIAYAFLQLALCRHLGKVPRSLVGHFGDTHIYKNHVEDAKPLTDMRVIRALPEWEWADDAPTSLFELEAEHLIIHSFEQGPSVKFKMAV